MSDNTEIETIQADRDTSHADASWGDDLESKEKNTQDEESWEVE